MDALKIVQMALDAAAAMAANGSGAKEDLPDGETKNRDGSVTIRRSFRLDPAAVAENSHPAKKKTEPGAPNDRQNLAPDDRQNLLRGLEAVSDADLDAIGYEDDDDDGGQSGVAQDSAPHACDEKGHDTPLENCKAQNPIFCPYHGIKAMQASFSAWMQHAGANPDGYAIDFVKKPSGAFQISVQCPDGTQNYVDEAIKGFLGQEGIIPVGDIENSAEKAVGGNASQMSATFKPDKAMRPDDLSMMNEWMDSLYQSALDEDSVVDLDDLTELESKLAELNGTDQGSLSEDQKKHFDELLADAKNHYHAMKAKVDYKDVGDVNEASEKGKELFDGFEESYAAAKKIQSDIQMAKQLAWGGSANPVGFPGNDELSKAGSAILKYDGDKMSDAKAALAEAVDAGDLDAAKKALHDMEYACDEAKKHLAAYGVHADAMKANLEKAIGKGLEKNSAVGKGKEGKMAWWEKQGISYPEELKAVKGVIEEMAQVGAKEKLAAAQEVAKEVVAKAAELGGQQVAAAQKQGKAAKPKAVPSNGETKAGSPDYDPFNVPKLEPLAHDESKFPANLTQSALDAAIAAGQNAGGGGGLGTKIVTIGDKKYICKSGTGKQKAAIENGFSCDMAYRAAGIHAPDAKLYKFGGKTYKLAEFIEGTRLDKIMSGSDGAKKDAARKELLKGYALDALFSNWDVLGTNPSSGLHFSNIIVDKDGNAYRIDNDGAFAMTGLVGGKKNPHQGTSDIPGVELEMWDSWADRQFCDDWITMRADSMNEGVFDGYSTHDIFDAAARIDFDAACASLPSDIQAALAKPKAEMVQMTNRCCDNKSGRMSNSGSSLMLDGSYALSKDGAREAIAGEKSQSEYGFGYSKSSGSHSGYQKVAFSEPEPVKPVQPATSHNYANDILNAAKTINYHNGGVGDMKTSVDDHAPNQSKMDAYEKAKPVIEKMAKAGNPDAKVLMGFVGDIENSKAAGFTKSIGICPTTFVISDSDSDKAAIKKYKKDIAEWQPKHDLWAAKKTQHDQAEAKKEEEYAKKHGKPKYLSLTDQIAKQCAKSGCDHSWIESSQDSQGGSSWSKVAVKAKVCEAILRGMDPKDPKMEGMWIGNNKDGNSGAFMAYCHEYASDPKQMQKDVKAFAIHKAGVQLMLENSNVAGHPGAINHDNHTVFVVRTEGWLGNISGKEYMSLYGHESGKVCKKFETGTCESHAVPSVTGHGAYYGARVPFSSVCGAYWMEGHPGQHDQPYLGLDEAEFTVDKHNLPHVPIVCFGLNKKDYGSFMSTYDKVVAAEKKASAGKKK